MKDKLTSKNDFEVASELKNQEKKLIIKNLSEDAKRKYEELEAQKTEAIHKTREGQGKRHSEDLVKERQKIIEKKKKLELKPPGRFKEDDKGIIEKQARRNVADTNRKEVSIVEKQHNQEINKFLAKEKIKLKETFHAKSRGDTARER